MHLIPAGLADRFRDGEPTDAGKSGASTVTVWKQTLSKMYTRVSIKEIIINAEEQQTTTATTTIITTTRTTITLTATTTTTFFIECILLRD
jgi:hypothetical protein